MTRTKEETSHVSVHTSTAHPEIPKPADDEAYLKWKNWRATDFGKFSLHDALYFSLEMDNIVGKDMLSRVLEIGYGNGRFLGWVRGHAVECHGVEASQRLCERAAGHLTAAYSSVFDSSLDALAGTFDAIVAFDVLEHINKPDLPEFMRQIFRLLKPGGTFLARFPNGDSPFGRLYQNGDLTHMTAIGKYMAAQLAQLSGLNLVVTRAQAYPLNANGLKGYPRRVAIKLVRRLLGNFLSAAIYDGDTITIESNLIAVWKKPS